MDKTSAGSPVKAAAPAPSPRTTRASQPLKLAGDEEKNGQETNARPQAMSGLELEEVEPASVLDGVVPLSVVESETERDIAGFSPPRDGLLGPFQYWLHVHQRLRILKTQLKEARETAESDNTESLRLQADFGRKLFEIPSPPHSLIPLMDVARLADGERSGTERKRVSRSMDHKSQTDGLNAAVQEIERNIAPIIAQQKKIEAEKQTLLEEKRGIETQQRRVQIDLRNMEKLILERKEKLQSPKTEAGEKEKLLLEINTFEQRCPTLEQQIHDYDASLEKLSIPLNASEMDLSGLTDQLAPAKAEISELKEEISELERKFQKEDQAACTLLLEETQKAAQAWARVTQRAISQRIDLPEHLKANRQSVSKAMIQANNSSRHTQLLEGALDCYDKPTIKKAQKQAAIIIVSILAICIGLIVLL